MSESRPPSYGIVPMDEMREMSGLEFLRRMSTGELPLAPISAVLRFGLTEVDSGRIVMEGTPSLDFYNPIGSVHGGYAATLLDSCMGCAVQSLLDAGQGYTTLEFKVNFVRALSEKTGPVRAEGKIVNAGRRIMTAEGHLTDRAGKLYAHGTTTCLVFPI